MTRVITVFPGLGQDAWLARFEDEADVQRLFGSDTVPTAVTLECSGGEVRSALQALNPGHLVRLVDVGGARLWPEDWPG